MRVGIVTLSPAPQRCTALRPAAPPASAPVVAEYDGTRREPVGQDQRGRCIVGLPRAQPEPERQALPIDDRVDLGPKAAPGTTETMISTPLFAVAACWCARMEVLSIIWISPS